MSIHSFLLWKNVLTFLYLCFHRNLGVRLPISTAGFLAGIPWSAGVSWRPPTSSSTASSDSTLCGPLLLGLTECLWAISHSAPCSCVPHLWPYLSYFWYYFRWHFGYYFKCSFGYDCSNGTELHGVFKLRLYPVPLMNSDITTSSNVVHSVAFPNTCE